LDGSQITLEDIPLNYLAGSLRDRIQVGVLLFAFARWERADLTVVFFAAQTGFSCQSSVVPI
jgi:hypothetical protein